MASHWCLFRSFQEISHLPLPAKTNLRGSIRPPKKSLQVGSFLATSWPTGNQFVGAPIYMIKPRRQPVLVTQVTTGTFHACVRKADGAITCWGNDDDGQLNAPTGSFIQINAGDFHTCAVRMDGVVLCWGNNGSNRATPPPGWFVQVDAGSTHTCGLQVDGSLACWGNNDEGQLNFPPGSYSQVSVGNSFSCGVKTDGSLVCWGSNQDHRAVAPAGVFTQVSCGNAHACALREDGTTVCWGYNFYQQAVSPAGVFNEVSAGGNHTCGRRPDGTVSCWGDNSAGQAPQLTLYPSILPVGVRGASYSLAFSTTGGLSPYQYSLVNGELPPGLNLTSTGSLTGIPTELGQSNFTVRVVDASTPAFSQRLEYSLQIDTTLRVFLPFVRK